MCSENIRLLKNMAHELQEEGYHDADLIGIPIRITIGKKSLSDGKVELKLRSESESKKIAVDAVVSQVKAVIESLKKTS